MPLLHLYSSTHPPPAVSLRSNSRPGTPGDAGYGSTDGGGASPGIMAMLLSAEEAKEKLEAKLQDSQVRMKFETEHFS